MRDTHALSAGAASPRQRILVDSLSGVAPLHYFSIAEVHCPSCGEAGLLYRDLILVRDRAKSGAVVRHHALTAFCPDCMQLHDLDSAERPWLHCCGRKHQLDEATFAGQHYRCSSCGATATHRELRSGAAPRRIVAVEECPPRERRALRSVSDEDLRAIENAADEWARRRRGLPHPSGALHAVRSDVSSRCTRPLSMPSCSTPITGGFVPRRSRCSISRSAGSSRSLAWQGRLLEQLRREPRPVQRPRPTGAGSCLIPDRWTGARGCGRAPRRPDRGRRATRRNRYTGSDHPSLPRSHRPRSSRNQPSLMLGVDLSAPFVSQLDLPRSHL